MEPQGLHKTFKEQLRPTPAQARALDAVVWRCRVLSNTALEQRKTARERCPIALSRYDQEAELKDIRAAFPEYAAIHSHVLQDVLARLQKTYDDFFRRLREGEQPGYPRSKGRTRYRSFTYFTCTEYGTGAHLDNGYLVLSRVGRMAGHGGAWRGIGPGPWWAPPRRSPAPKRPTAGMWRSRARTYRCSRCPSPGRRRAGDGQETGRDLGLESFAPQADGEPIHNPRWYRRAEAYVRRCQRRVARRKKGSQRRRKAVKLLAKAHQHIATQRRDFQHKEARKLVQPYDVIYHEDLRVRTRGPH